MLRMNPKSVRVVRSFAFRDPETGREFYFTSASSSADVLSVLTPDAVQARLESGALESVEQPVSTMEE